MPLCAAPGLPRTSPLALGPAVPGKRSLDLDRLNRRFGPWISLAMGAGTLLLVRRGIGFSPWAALILLGAWVGATVAGAWLPQRAAAGEPATAGRGALGVRVRRAAPALLASVSVSLYQNVLFFLLPLWFASATWPSANILFPLVLSGMAGLSCFEYPYRRWVLERPARRALFSGAVLFATLVLAGPLVTFAPLRVYFALAAATAALVALVALAARRPQPGSRWRWLRRAGFAAGVTGLAAGLGALSVPLLPPVPLTAVTGGVGTGLDARLALTGQAERFAAGTPRLHAWFSVAAPSRYQQPVVFSWYRDGEPVRTFRARVTGGRQGGFRTWDWLNAHRPGHWRVDLQTDSGALIGRKTFEITSR